MEALERIIKKIGIVGTVCGVIVLSIIALIISITVIGRAMHVAFAGTFDLVETLVVVTVSFALVYGQLEDHHIRADLAIERLRGRVKAAIESFLGILSLVYWAALLWAGWIIMLEKWGAGETTDILNVPVVPFRGVWVFALTIMLLLLVLKEIRNIKWLIKGGEEK
jgi:TRAP-type C4-dicarboxylate transport system permease small subunit